MSLILIADPCKPSLVMSSEVFKDKIAGSQVLVANSGQECLDILKSKSPDMCVIDFDLPDTDGVTLYQAMRRYYNGPIIITAHPDTTVEGAVTNELFPYLDGCAWVKKPVRFNDLAEKIDRFLLGKYRVQKRFDVTLPALLLGKSSGRGKRTPKETGRVLNLSIGGACVGLKPSVKYKLDEDITIAFPFIANGTLPGVEPRPAPDSKRAIAMKAKPKAKKSAKKTASKDKIAAKSTRAGASKASDPFEKFDHSQSRQLKAKVAWIDSKNQKLGVKFEPLNSQMDLALQSYLRSLPGGY